MTRKKILVVDDNAFILKAFSTKLRACGYEVITAEDGGSAVGVVRQQPPDLILLDISFPPDVAHGGGVPWDGFLILDWVRRLDEARNTPVIVISGEDPAKYRERALAAGAVCFLHKPVGSTELLSAVRSALGDPPRPQPPGPGPNAH